MSSADAQIISLSPICRGCPIGQATIYSPTFSIDPEMIDRIKIGARAFPQHRRLFNEGDRLDELSIIKSGWAYRFRDLSNGRRQILAFYIPGDAIPFEALSYPGRAIPYSAKTLTAVSLCVFSMSEFIRLLNSTTSQLSEYQEAMRRHSERIYNQLADIGRRSALGRVAGLILSLDARLRRRGLVTTNEYHFPLRQEHIADALGLTSVHVNRTLASLRRDGIVELSDQKLKILDRKSLEILHADE